MEIRKELGYYQCGDKLFASKIKACIYSSQTKQELKWFFNNEIFDSVDWSIEPEHSLDYYYDLRCRELREKYDYLILSYSGGADSHNILKCFERQNLIVDEIIVNVYEKMNTVIKNDVTEKDSSNYGAEYKLQIYPRLEEIRQSMPKTKITVLDLSDAAMEIFSEDESWVLERQEHLNLSGSTRYNYWYHSNVKKQFDLGKKVAIILGTEKPFLFVDDDKLYHGFTDKLVNLASVEPHKKEYDNCNIEYFYWNPSCSDMIRKQIHVVKRWLETNPQYVDLWKINDLENYRKNIPTIHNILKNLIYTTWNNNWFQTDKNVFEWYCEIDEWFHLLYNDTKQYKIWKKGINYVCLNAPDFIEFKNGVADGLKSFYHVYLIGEIKKSNI